MRPAWSFESHEVGRVEPLPLSGRITTEWAWHGSTGAGVKVAVVDSGIDPSHSQVRSVAGAVALEYDAEADGLVRTVEGQHEDLFGHGTACAGLIRRVAPDAELYSVRVLGRRLTGKGAVFAASLRWAIDNGMRVVNMSLSTGKADFFAQFHELADEAYFKNIVLVCAANNMPGPSYPSLYSSVVSVASHSGRDPFGFDYNPTPPVEFAAPGIDVEVAWLDGTTITATGNSFAAPCVTGLIARILSKHPMLTPFQVKTVLHDLASNVERGTCDR